MKEIIFLPQAEQEMNEAALFYDAHVRGLGREFLFAVKKATNDIANAPAMYPIRKNGIRRRLVSRFPYGILYREEKAEIVIIAVMHLRRAPDYWRHRVSESAKMW